VLAHRIRLTARAELHGLTAESVVRAVLEEVPVPVEEVVEGA
jgi:MoxR-like ATPase